MDNARIMFIYVSSRSFVRLHRDSSMVNTALKAIIIRVLPRNPSTATCGREFNCMWPCSRDFN